MHTGQKYQVTLLFPSFQSFRLWCRATGVSYDPHEAQALRLDGQPLGRYCPAPDAVGGILAEVAIQLQGGKQHENATV